MDEISQGPRDDRPSAKRPRWLPAAAIACVVAVAAVLAVTRGGANHSAAAPHAPGATSHGPRPAAAATRSPTVEFSARMVVPQVLQATAAPGPLPMAVPGTLLLTCDSVLWGQLQPDWRAGSLRVGPLWLVGARQLGYAHLGHAQPPGGTQPVRAAAGRAIEMLVHVDAGSTVAIRAAGAPPDFRFTEAGLGPDISRAGNRGFTLSSCPRGADGSGGWTDFYDLGFFVVPGHAASVEVWTSLAARPVWLTFTAPAGAD